MPIIQDQNKLKIKTLYVRNTNDKDIICKEYFWYESMFWTNNDQQLI